MPGLQTAHGSSIDSSTQAFLAEDFSPVDYLNSLLPKAPEIDLPAISGKPQKPYTQNASEPVLSLSALASQSQAQISALAAQQTRLTTTLTELTDEILRSSSRLAYEVELLRGEALSLAETLSQNGALQAAISKFVPSGLLPDISSSGTVKNQAMASGGEDTTPSSMAIQPQTPTSPKSSQTRHGRSNEPASLDHLRTLQKVRGQLDSVIQNFHLALSFQFPLSLLAGPASSFITIQPPDVDPKAEERGQMALDKIKTDLQDLIKTGDLSAARQKVRDLQRICMIWQGTAEEQARTRWVDGLSAIISAAEPPSQESPRAKRPTGSTGSPRAPRNTSDKNNRGQTPVNTAGNSSGGFLRRLRDEIYLD